MVEIAGEEGVGPHVEYPVDPKYLSKRVAPTTKVIPLWEIILWPRLNTLLSIPKL